MRCSTCGHDNPTTNSFCSHCASSLAKERATNSRSKTVYLPQFEDEIETKSPARKSSSGLGWIIVFIFLGVIAWVLYGQISGI